VDKGEDNQSCTGNESKRVSVINVCETAGKSTRLRVGGGEVGWLIVGDADLTEIPNRGVGCELMRKGTM